MKLNNYLIPIILLSSCKSIIINTLIRDAKVENTASIKKFQIDNKFDTSNSFIVKADTATAMKWIEKGIASYEIYNSDGRLIEFIGKEDCPGVQFQFFLEGKKDSFKVNNNILLLNLLDNCYNYENRKANKKDLPKSDYYVVTYWSKFMGRKFGYKQAVGYTEDDIKDNKLKKYLITVIKVNTDLQESWGMQPKGRMSVKMKVRKTELDFVFGKLPIKK